MSKASQIPCDSVELIIGACLTQICICSGRKKFICCCRDLENCINVLIKEPEHQVQSWGGRGGGGFLLFHPNNQMQLNRMLNSAIHKRLAVAASEDALLSASLLLALKKVTKQTKKLDDGRPPGLDAWLRT